MEELQRQQRLDAAIGKQLKIRYFVEQRNYSRNYQKT